MRSCRARDRWAHSAQDLSRRRAHSAQVEPQQASLLRTAASLSTQLLEGAAPCPRGAAQRCRARLRATRRQGAPRHHREKERRACPLSTCVTRAARLQPNEAEDCAVDLATRPEAARQQQQRDSKAEVVHEEGARVLGGDGHRRAVELHEDREGAREGEADARGAHHALHDEAEQGADDGDRGDCEGRHARHT